jgi:heterodisulfide reductase subunit A-like polyferredoxin
MVDPLTMATNRAGVFAGGDVVTGPATVVEAIAAGRRAAESIDRFLQGLPPQTPEPPEPTTVESELFYTDEVSGKGRESAPSLHPIARIFSFDEIEGRFSEEQARAEARRCLRCGIERRRGKE